MVLSNALQRYKAVKYILFHSSSFPIFPLLSHLPLPQWIYKASEKSGEWCVYPLGSKLFTHSAPQNSD